MRGERERDPLYSFFSPLDTAKDLTRTKTEQLRSLVDGVIPFFQFNSYWDGKEKGWRWSKGDRRHPFANHLQYFFFEFREMKWRLSLTSSAQSTSGYALLFCCHRTITPYHYLRYMWTWYQLINSLLLLFRRVCVALPNFYQRKTVQSSGLVQCKQAFVDSIITVSLFCNSNSSVVKSLKVECRCTQPDEVQHYFGCHHRYARWGLFGLETVFTFYRGFDTSCDEAVMKVKGDSGIKVEFYQILFWFWSSWSIKSWSIYGISQMLTENVTVLG